MRALTIALKDLRRSLGTPFSLVMMFVAPLLITALLYFAFGNLSDGGFDLAPIAVQVVNLDQGSAQAGGFAGGAQLVAFLQGEDLDLLQVTVVDDAARARAAVDRQEAAVAILIPADFTAAALAADGEASIALYQDPTLTIGPRIVEDLVRQFIDGFAGARIAADVAVEQFRRRDVPVDAGLAQQVTQQYAGWLESAGHHDEEHGASSVQTRPPAGGSEANRQGAGMMGPIMASMMIFFVFFIGANAAESIVREENKGTLPRLFTTPTPQASILGGKYAAVVCTLLIQVLVLLVASSLLFGIRWGAPLPVALLTIGLIAAAAGFGVLLMSFIRTTRQAGPVMGGVLTITGMLGGLFTAGIPNAPRAFQTISLATPHGWALRGWKAAIAGGGVGEVLLPAAVTFGAGMLFFAIGLVLFRKRFS